MRVVQLVISDRFAGVERHIATLAPALAERGAEVVVVGGDPAAMRANLAGVEHVPAATSAEAAAALARIGRADVVNSHMTDADVLAARTARRLGAARVSTRHFGLRRGSQPLLRPALRWAVRGIAAQIAVSQYVADEIEGASTVVHPGVADAEAGTDRRKTVLVAQRLESEKDTTTALRAWARTTARRDGWRLAVAGDGADRGRIAALAQELGIADTVDILGFRSDVHDLMSGAGMLLASAPQEHLGLSVLEAMARATPVVATGAAGHLETAGPVDGASLFPPGDADAAARAIDRLAFDDALRTDLGARLQQRQRTEFALPRAAERTLAVYQGVLSR